MDDLTHGSLLPFEGETPRDTVTRLLSRVREVSGAAHAAVWSYEPGRRGLAPVAVDPDDADDPAVAALLALGEATALRDAVEERRVLRVDNPSSDPRFGAELAAAASFHAEPLVAGAPCGLLVVAPAAAAAATAALVPFLAAATAQLNAWHDADVRALRAEVLLAISEMAGEDSLDDLLAAACVRLADALGMRRAAVFLADNGVLVPRAAQFADGRVDDEAWQACRDSSHPPPFPEVAAEGRSVVVEDAAAAPLPTRWWLETFSAGAAVAVPIGVPSDVLGILTLDTPHPRRFPHGVVDVAVAAGAELARAIRRVREAEDRSRRLRNETAVRRALEEGSRASSLREAAEVLARVACDALAADAGAALLRGADGRIADVVEIAVPEPYAAKLRGLVAQPADTVVVWQQAAAERAPVLVEGPAAGDLLPQVVADAGVGALAALPLLAGGETIGLVVCARSGPGRWRPADRDLLARLTGEGSLVVENAALREAEQRRLVEMTYRAFHDPLTGLANRALLLDRIGHALARAERHGHRVAVLFIDLDRFKEVNDTLGHDAGDELLVRLAGRLQAVVRPADTVARFAGDEFVVGLEEVAGEDEALRVADRVVAAIERPTTLMGREVAVTASVGAAVAEAGEADPEELVRRADLAMYRAKREGTRRELYRPATEAGLMERLALGGDLEHALERGELAVHYQPVIALDDGRLVGVEALVRWAHPRLGILTPHYFIPIAEERGLITAIDRWVVEEACRQLAAWERSRWGGDDLSVYVNLSARSAANPGAVDDVRRVIDAASLAPRRVVVEVGEPDAVAHADAIAGSLAGLREAGARAALDDFGTGQSSLRFIQQLPLDILKIDRSFVDGLGLETGDTALVRAVIDVGQNLGLEVVAEGIETPTQLQMLRELRCPYGQGNLLAAPLDAVQLEVVLEAAPWRSRLLPRR